MTKQEFEAIYTDKLQPKQRPVLKKFLQNKSDEQIANSFSPKVTKNCVSRHISTICKLFNIKNELGYTQRNELIVLFVKYKPELVCKDLLEEFGARASEPRKKLESPERALRFNSEFYVERSKMESDCYQEILEPGSMIRIKAPKLMGKTSLLNRIMERARTLVRGGTLSRKVDADSWWQQRQLLSPSQRLSQFIEDVLLTDISQNIVIFIDEIDSILNLTWKDDFFLLIRACYNKRPINPEFKRLAFCLLGVATPADLIRDKDRTPFNIGNAIDLTGFTFEEARPALIPGLIVERSAEISEEILAEVFNWTNGQPFLMQRLCRLMVYQSARGTSDVKAFVKKYVIDNWEANDELEHLKRIRDRLLLDYQDRTALLLGIYQQILTEAEHKISADNSLDQRRLQLSGLVVKRNGYLQVYNPIYAAIFNLDWVQQELAKLRPYQENFAAWIASNRQDTSRLLHGQALDDALQWKVGKRLSDEDNDFLDASEADERQELKKNNESLREFRKEFREVLKIEEAGRNALELFQSEGKQIQALRVAIKTGEDLKKWIPDNPLLSEYPVTNPLLALQMILAKIRERYQFIGHNDWVTSVSFSPTGDAIATGSSDNSAKLWDLHGNCLVTFTGHNYWINSVSFSPTGNTIATASVDKTAKLWDLQGNLLANYSGYKGNSLKGEADFVELKSPIYSVCFSRDGKFLITGSQDGKVRFLPVESWDELLVRGREWLGENF